MPTYVYRCQDGHVVTQRRPFTDRERPAACECGSLAMVTFSPNPNIFVPVSFRQVLTGGEMGGGQLSWSDFHDRSEKELAKDPNVEKYERVVSLPNNGAPPVPKGITMGEAFKEAKARINYHG